MSRKTGIERLQEAFNRAQDNTIISNLRMDELLVDKDLPEILKPGNTARLEDDDMWEYYYLMEDAPFLGK